MEPITESLPDDRDLLLCLTQFSLGKLNGVIRQDLFSLALKFHAPVAASRQSAAFVRAEKGGALTRRRYRVLAVHAGCEIFSLATTCAMWIMTHAALAEYRFDVWTADSGLPQNSISSILQSHDGYLWLSTSDGLVRFDGVRFTVFDKVNSPGLRSNRLRPLYEDGDGDLWIGLEEGGLARYHQGRFTPFTSQHGLPASLVQSISGDKQGNLWVLSDNVLLRWKEGRFVPGLPESVAALFDPKIMRFSPRGIIWATNQEALHLFSRGKLTTLALSNGLPSLRISQVDEDQYGTWWVAMEDAGLAKVRDGKVIKVFSEL